MCRVLLTGATGFVGRAAANALTGRGLNVHGTTRRLSQFAAGMAREATLHEVELFDRSGVESLIAAVKPTHLLIAAWTTRHGEYWTDPSNDNWASATEMLVRSFFGSGGQRAVLVGTCAEYDWRDPAIESGPIGEYTACGPPHTPYGRAKRRAGEALRQQAEIAGKSYAIARLFYPIGPGEDRRRLLPQIIAALLAGRPADIGAPENVRDVMDIRDVAAALADMLMSNVTGPVNIGTGKGTRLGELANCAASALGHPELLRANGEQRRAGEPVTLVPDIARLLCEVKFRPRYSLMEAVKTAVEYWTKSESTFVGNGEAH